MTASSSKYSLPSAASTAPGCGPWLWPPGCSEIEPLADAAALAGLVVAGDVEHDLVAVHVRVVVRHRHGQRVVVDLARHEVADHEVPALEDLVHRRRLVDPAGDRLVVLDVERVRVHAAVPADHVERVGGVHDDAAHDPVRAVAAVLGVHLDVGALDEQRLGRTRAGRARSTGCARGTARTCSGSAWAGRCGCSPRSGTPAPGRARRRRRAPSGAPWRAGSARSRRPGTAARRTSSRRRPAPDSMNTHSSPMALR